MDDNASAEEALFAMVGRYLVFFQWLEGKIDQCLLLVWGLSNWSESQKRLVGMANHDKVNALLKAFRESDRNARGRARGGWSRRFENLIERLHEERRCRNSLVHAQFLFDLLPLGEAVVLSHRRMHGGAARFDQLALSSAEQRAWLERLAGLAMDLNIAHTQLIHDDDEPS